MAEKSKSRPRQETGPAHNLNNNNTLTRPEAGNVEAVKRGLGQIEDVLDRHGVHRRGKMVRCIAPDHDDKTPSASIFEGVRGERLYCHGCGWTGDSIDVAEILGERIEWPRGRRPAPVRRNRRPVHAMPRGVALAFLADERAVTSWAIAVELAVLPEAVARQHILAAWGGVSESCDIALVVRWSRLIRGTALLNLSTSKSVESPRAVAYAVRRLVSGNVR